MATVSRIGFGQVEPNLLTGYVEGKIYAQYPADTEVLGEILENGRFVKYDGAALKVNLNEDAGQWLMVYNEIKLYDEREQGARFYAMQTKNAVDGVITPRLIAIEVGDIFTTNCLGAAATSATAKTASGITFSDDPEEATILAVDKTTGYLVDAADDNADTNGPQFRVIQQFAGNNYPLATMPDNSPMLASFGVKLQRIK